jgi:hypothetical protein
MANKGTKIREKNWLKLLRQIVEEMEKEDEEDEEEIDPSEIPLDKIFTD